MLATAGPLPHGPGWAFEFAWEGARTLVDAGRDEIRLISGDRGFIVHFPELDGLRSLARRRRIVLDGTIVALDAFGRPSLPRLQRRMAVQRPSPAMLGRLPVAYYVFDLLRLGSRATTELPYQQRRDLLEELSLPGGAVALAPSFTDTDGHAVLDTAAQYGLHGVVAKRTRSRYRPGRRTRSWVETTLRRTQEVVVGGWLRRRGGDLGAVLVGVPTEHGLHFAGRVGTGFSHAARRELAERLAGMERGASPFRADPGAAGARWVAPELIGEVGFRRWSAEGRLERPTWLGLRPERHPAGVQVPVLLAGRAGATIGRTAGPHELHPEQLNELNELDGALRRARAEVDALRAQISPHFLYNVLNMINTYVRIDPPLAKELLAEFADFTRYAFRTGVQTSTVSEELDNVERYLTLQRARFGERLRVDLQVCPEVLPVALPFLAVQLAVESAVQNSIEPKPGGGTVTITAATSGADCVIMVADDGAGSDPAGTLRTLDERLRAAYGEHRGLTVQAPNGGGTRVSFRVPMG